MVFFAKAVNKHHSTLQTLQYYNSLGTFSSSFITGEIAVILLTASLKKCKDKSYFCNSQFFYKFYKDFQTRNLFGALHLVMRCEHGSGTCKEEGKVHLRIIR